MAYDISSTHVRDWKRNATISSCLLCQHCIGAVSPRNRAVKWLRISHWTLLIDKRRCPSTGHRHSIQSTVTRRRGKGSDHPKPAGSGFGPPTPSLATTATVCSEHISSWDSSAEQNGRKRKWVRVYRDWTIKEMRMKGTRKRDVGELGKGSPRTG